MTRAIVVPMPGSNVQARDRWTIGLSLGVSLLLHVLVLLPYFHRSASGVSASASSVAADLAVHPPDPSDRPRPIEPGIEESQAITMAWIGYEAYEEHLARLAEVDQAAFTPDPQPAEAGGPAAVMEVAEAQEPVEADVADAAESVEELESLAARGLADDEQAPQVPERSDEAFDPADVMRQVMGALASGAPPAGTMRQPDVDPEVQRDAQEASPQERAETSAQDASPEGASDGPGESAESADAPPHEGAPRDLESQAASTLDLRRDQLHPGRPIARQGLELFPRQPVFTTLTRMTALPRNPIVEIRFGPTGVPLEAEIMRSSGNQSVDDALLSSLFRWRAHGAALAELASGETADIRIRIVLNPYARE